MAVINNTNQIKYGGRAYLDPKLDPVRTVADLPSEITEIFNGMTVTVLDGGDGKPVDYWRINGQWVVKSTGGGASYTAGQYIDITNDVISVTGISPDSYAIKADVATAITAAQNAAVATATAWTESQGYLTEVPANLATKDEVASAKTEVEEWVNEQGFLTEHQDISGKADISAVTADIEAVMAAETARTESTYLKQASLDEYASKAEVSSAISESEASVKEWVGEQGYLTEVPAEYAKSADVATAVTEARDEAIVAATAWTEAQGFLVEVPAEYAKSADVATAITEAQEEAVVAATAWTEGQGYLKEVPAEYAKTDDVASAITEAQDETFIAATAWTEGQGYLKEVPAEYAKTADVATAITEAVAEKQDAFELGDAVAIDENNKLNVLVDGVTIKINGSNKLYADVSGSGGTYTAGEYISIEGNEISVTGITPDEYAKINDVATAITEAQDETFIAATAWTEAQGYMKDVPGGYATLEDVATAETAAIAAATAWTEEQGFLKEVPAEYAKSADVATAITEAEGEMLEAATAWTEAQGYLTEVPAEYAKTDEVSSAITEAQEETFVAATAWTEEQGFLKEVPEEYAKKAEVSVAIEEAKDETLVAATAWTEAQEYAKATDVATAITEAQDETFIAATAWTEEQGFLKEVPAEYAKLEDVSSAATAAVAEATAWTEEQGYLKEVPSEFVTVSELNNEIEDAKDEMFTESTVWVEAQGYMKEVPGGYATNEDVASAAAETFAAATAWTEEQGFLTEVPAEYAKTDEVASAITEAQDETFVAATAWTESQGYLTEVPAEYAKSADVATAITEAVAEKQDAFTAGTAVELDANNNLNVLIDGVTIKVNGSNKLYAEVSSTGGTYSAGQYINIDGNEISVTGITPDDYATVEELSAETQARIEAEFDINAKFSEYPKITEVNSAITEAQDETFVAVTAWTEAQGYLKEVPANLATKDEVASAKTEAVIEAGIYTDGVADDILSAVTEAKAEAVEEATAWTESQGYLTEVPAEYAKVEDVATAITEAQDETFIAATAWTEAQGYLKEVPGGYATHEEVTSAATAAVADATAWTEAQGYLTEVPAEYAKVADVATAITEAQDETFIAATAWTEAQGYLKEVPAEYAKSADVATAITEAQEEAFVAATAWTEAQGYLTEVPSEYAKTDEVASAITEAQDETFVAATAWTESQGYLTEVPAEYAKSADVATAITEAVASANSYTDAAVSAITHPEYSLSSITPSSGYSASYELMKDGSAVTGSAIINIPDTAGATIRSAITTDIAVGYVSAGTTFSAGTMIETILRAIFINDTPTSIGYAYYGSLATPLDETTGITAENIKAYLSRSESAASTTPWRFRVNEGDHQIIVAAPLTFELDDANDVTNGIPYYNEISNNGAPLKTLTIDDIQYGVYYVTYGVEMSRFMMEITLINA